MSVSKRVAYLRGLADGYGLTNEAAQGKFYKELLDCLEELSEVVEYLEEENLDLNEYIEDIDDDLSVLEDHMYDFDDEDDYEYDDDDEDIIETICPGCGETIGYYDAEYDGTVEIICPNCDAVVATIEGDDDDIEVDTQDELETELK